MYCELQCKTNYSFLEGASSPEELVAKAHELGLYGLAITDRNGVYGMPKAYWASRSYQDFKFLVGSQVAISHPLGGSSFDLTLIVRDRAAYGLMCRLLTAAHAKSEKGEALLEFGEFKKFLSEPSASGLVFLVSASVPIEYFRQELKGDQCYITLNRFFDGFDNGRTHDALKLSERWNVPLVATNDVYCHIRERFRLQDSLTCIRYTTTLKESGYKLFSNHERFLKSATEMKKNFNDLPDAISNTVLIANSCHFSPKELRYYYPSEWIPRNHTSQSYLEELVWQGAKNRYGNIVPADVRQQLNHELVLVAQLNYADYFLTIYEIVNFARERQILCQGRGSAANSAICFVLGITAIDPVRMNLLFERFVSVERDEPPDIDVDFEHEHREEVIQHIYQKYGRHRAAMVSAVVTFQERMAQRELKKIFSLEPDLKNEKLREKLSPKELEVFNSVKDELIGFPRHLSIHSGGFTLSGLPLTEIVPVEPARMEGRTIIQWDKYDLDYLGLLKVDILSLGMLSALRKTLNATGLKLYEIPADDPETFAMIGRADTVGTFQIESRAQMSMLGRLQPKNFYDLVIEVAIVRPGPIVGKMVHPYLKRRRGEESITYEHPKLKQILGKTLGVPLFQEQIMKIAMELANFTPGEADQLRRALGAWRSDGSVGKVIQRLRNGLLRSGLSEKFIEQILGFIKGFSEYGFPESHAASFALLAYASCYLRCHYLAEFICALLNSQPMGFYRSHTLIDDARRCGIAILPLDPNISQWETVVEPIFSSHNQVRPQSLFASSPSPSPSPSSPPPLPSSLSTSTISNLTKGNGQTQKGLRLGWNLVKGLNQNEAQQIIAQRPYRSLEDFLLRSCLRQDVVRRLVMADIFSGFGLDQRHTFWNLLSFLVRSKGDQLDLFGYSIAQKSGSYLQSDKVKENIVREDKVKKDTAKEGKVKIDKEDTSSLKNPNYQQRSDQENEKQKLFSRLSFVAEVNNEYEALGVSAKAHPMTAAREQFKINALSAKKVKQCTTGSWVKAAGMVVIRQHPPTAKGMTFCTLEDETGFIDLAIRPQEYERFREVFYENRFLLIQGILQKDQHAQSVLVKKIDALFEDNIF